MNFEPGDSNDNTNDDDVVFFESPPGSPTLFHSDEDGDNGSVEFFDSPSTASAASFDLAVSAATAPAPTTTAPPTTTTNTTTTTAMRSRAAFLQTTDALRRELNESDQPEAPTLIPAVPSARPNTSFMVLQSTQVKDPTFDLPTQTKETVAENSSPPRNNSLFASNLLSLPAVSMLRKRSATPSPGLASTNPPIPFASSPPSTLSTFFKPSQTTKGDAGGIHQKRSMPFLKQTTPNQNQQRIESTSFDDIDTTNHSSISPLPHSPKLARKVPPPPRLQQRKPMNLDKKLELAKLCVEGSRLYAVNAEEAAAWKEEGYALLRELSANGLADANYYLGTCFAADGNYIMAFPSFLRAARANFPEANFAAASCLEFGHGCPVSFLTAQYYYEQAAHVDHLPAMHRLAVAMLRGELDYEVNIFNGVKWLERCADYPTPDPLKSLSLYQLSHLYSHGPTNFTRSHILALKYLQESCSPPHPHPGALCRLARAYEAGELGLQVDMRRSVKLYEDAVQAGDLEAMFCLADLLVKGVSVVEWEEPGSVIPPPELKALQSPEGREEEYMDSWSFPGFVLTSAVTSPGSHSDSAASSNVVVPMGSEPSVITSYAFTSLTRFHTVTILARNIPRAVQLLNHITGLETPLSTPPSAHVMNLQSDALFALGYLHEHGLVEGEEGEGDAGVMFYEAAAVKGSVRAAVR
ncbi:hypothetical protein HDU98_002705, partial [Podochytrium sp. JEL0797]